MIGGLLVDAMVLAAVVAFAWAGMQFGGRASISRLVASYAAFALAALLRDPVGLLIEAALGTSEDFARLTGMVIVGVGSYVAATSLATWWLRRRTAAAPELDIEEGGPFDRLDGPRVGAVAGGVLGYAWVVTFVGLLVLLPSDTLVSRSAIDSWTGGRLIRHERALRWFADGFPHYTQTLPKGEDGVVVGERSSVPMRGEDEPKVRARDTDIVLDAVNDLRRSRRVRTLAFNPDVAGVARRHALALASDHSLSYSTPGGGSLDDRVGAALGEAAGAFDAAVGIEVVWGHHPANAGIGLVKDSRAAALMRDSRWTQIGIGTADAGWFDGRIYVLLLIGPPAAPDEEAGAGGSETEGGAGATAAAGTLPSNRGELPDVPDAGAAGDAGCDDPAVDLDGDGLPDSQSVDPALTECPQASGPVAGL